MSRAAIARYENSAICRSRGLREGTPTYKACIVALKAQIASEDDGW